MIDENELSDREIEIIRLVATGASNKEIAIALFISPNTVKVHLRNIFGKLGVLSRTEATMTAIRMGLVDSPSIHSTNSTEISSNIDGNWPIQEQDIQPRVVNKRYLFFAISLGLIVLVLMGYLLNRVITESNQSIPTISAAEIEELSSNRWSSIQNMPNGLSGMGYVRYENKFLIFGGSMKEGNSDLLWIYEIDNDVWKEGSKIPLAVRDFQTAMVGEMIFLPGGIDNSNNARSELWIYNPREDSWEPGADIPQPVSAYSLVPFEGKLYLFGGFDGLNYLDTVFVYDPILDEWTLSGHMSEAKAFSSAVVLGGQIHVIGGKNDAEILVNHDIYFPQREVLGENAWEKAAELPQGRFGMNSIVLADMIYTVGGNDLNGETLPLIQYLPPKDSWVEIDNPPIEIGLSPAVLPYETRLYVLGGIGSEGFSDQSLVYQAVYTILVPVVR